MSRTTEFCLRLILVLALMSQNACAAPERVVALEGSLAQIWTLAGGTLAGITSDVLERGIEAEGASVVGSVKTPNVERILSLSPDLILMPADIARQASLAETFDALGIAYRFERVDCFEDYLSALRDYCDMTGRDDLYAINGESVAQRVKAVIDGVPQDVHPRALLLRAYSSGVRVKGRDNLAGRMLSDLGCVNIADAGFSPFEELSLEAIVKEDPDFVFISVMGDEEGAKAFLEAGLFANPAWRALTAVAEHRCVFLPKEFFHYKPNNRWDESYLILREALYGKT